MKVGPSHTSYSWCA